VARRAPLAALAAALVCLAAIIVFTGGASYHLRAVFTAALQVRPGQQVRVAGRVVGSVSSVSLYDDEALVGMNIEDSQWPLHAGTTAQLRYGAAASYASRYVQLQPGPSSGPLLNDNALLPAADTITPVEFDQIFSMFSPRTRANLRGVISGAQQTSSGHGRDLARDLSLGGRGAQQTAGFLGDLGFDPAALSTLTTAGATTVSALHDTDPELQGLVSNGAATLRVLADNAGALTASIARLPPTLAATRPMLGHLDRSLNGLGALVSDLRPGAAGLLATAHPLRHALQTLVRVAPLAESTLATGTRRLPALTRFLTATRPFVPGLGSALRRLAPMLACVRPYAPEIAGWLATWQGGLYDNVGHYGAIDVVQTPVMPGTSDTSAQAVANSHGALSYAFPRPPGLNAGQTWFQPQCGAGPDALNPKDDPEAGR
jgi:virulence factor Mce-like protein